MKAFVIDPAAQNIEEIDTEGGYMEIRDLIGCESAGAVYPSTETPRLILWIDDNGLLHDDVQPHWQMNGVGDILTGKGVLLGLTEPDGDHCDVPYNRGDVRINVIWRPDLKFAGMVTTQEEVEHPHLGKMTKITTKSIFEKREAGDGEA